MFGFSIVSLYTVLCLLHSSHVFVLWFRTNSKRPWKRNKATVFEVGFRHVTEGLLSVDPDSNGFRCYYCSVSSPQASRGSFSKRTSDYLSLLRSAVSENEPRNQTVERVLEAYLRKSICSQHSKQIDQLVPSFWAGQTSLWIEQLQTLYDDDKEALMTKTIRPRSTSPTCQDGITGTNDRDGTSSDSPLLRACTDSSSEPPGAFPASQEDTQDLLEKMGPEYDVPCVPESYRMRFKHSCTIREVLDEESCEAQGMLVPYAPKCSTDPSLCDLITKTLSLPQSRTGSIYAYRKGVSSSQEQRAYVKIGLTTTSVQQRFAAWSRSCGYELEMEYQVDDVPNIGRVESLIHKDLELAGKRWVDQDCKRTTSKCKKAHQEWFKIDEYEARSIINYWTTWMKEFAPYNAAGDLSVRATLSLYQPCDQTVINMADETTNSNRTITFGMNSRGEAWLPVLPQTDQRSTPLRVARRSVDERSLDDHAVVQGSLSGSFSDDPRARWSPDTKKKEPATKKYRRKAGSPGTVDEDNTIDQSGSYSSPKSPSSPQLESSTRKQRKLSTARRSVSEQSTPTKSQTQAWTDTSQSRRRSIGTPGLYSENTRKVSGRQTTPRRKIEPSDKKTKRRQSSANDEQAAVDILAQAQLDESHLSTISADAMDLDEIGLTTHEFAGLRL